MFAVGRIAYYQPESAGGLGGTGKFSCGQEPFLAWSHLCAESCSRFLGDTVLADKSRNYSDIEMFPDLWNKQFPEYPASKFDAAARKASIIPTSPTFQQALAQVTSSASPQPQSPSAESVIDSASPGQLQPSAEHESPKAAVPSISTSSSAASGSIKSGQPTDATSGALAPPSTVKSATSSDKVAETNGTFPPEASSTPKSSPSASDQPTTNTSSLLIGTSSTLHSLAQNKSGTGELDQSSTMSSNSESTAHSPGFPL